MTPTTRNFSHYLAQAILLTLPCCLAFGRLAIFCLPFGIVAIVYVAQAKTRLQLGDDLGAVKASKNANKWFWFGFIPPTIILILVLVLYKYYCSNSVSCEVLFYNF
ncbi:MAG: CD225/dispanin family protein [Cyanobacteriota bacterium]|nr:CD225/dispanin family protein [Cyanobacteriota bacterium]